MFLYLILINAVAVLFMLTDKLRAKKGRWRIPEKTLFLIAAAGGSLGIIIGMRLFRHKTKREQFANGIPFILAVQIILAVILYYL